MAIVTKIRKGYLWGTIIASCFSALLFMAWSFIRLAFKKYSPAWKTLAIYFLVV
jgi:hypothetical protein